MKQSIKIASGVTFVLAAPVLIVIGVQFLMKKDGDVSTNGRGIHEAKLELLDAGSRGCCCAYCTQIRT